MKFHCDSSVLLACFGCFLLVADAGLSAKDVGEHWVGTWATAPTKDVPAAQSGPAPDFAGCTLRQIVHVSAGAKKLRIRLSNAFGSTPVKLGSVHVALSAGIILNLPVLTRIYPIMDVSVPPVSPQSFVRRYVRSRATIAQQETRLQLRSEEKHLQKARSAVRS